MKQTLLRIYYINPEIVTDENGMVIKEYIQKYENINVYGHIQPYTNEGIFEAYGMREEYKRLLFIEQQDIELEKNDIIVTEKGNFRVVEVPWDYEHVEAILDVYGEDITS